MSHAPLKRKADQLDDSDEEEPMLGRQVLPVANLPESFDGVPMDGLQYLFTVRYGALTFLLVEFMSLIRVRRPTGGTQSCYPTLRV